MTSTSLWYNQSYIRTQSHEKCNCKLFLLIVSASQLCLCVQSWIQGRLKPTAAVLLKGTMRSNRMNSYYKNILHDLASLTYLDSLLCHLSWKLWLSPKYCSICSMLTVQYICLLYETRRCLGTSEEKFKNKFETKISCVRLTHKDLLKEI